MVDISDWVGVTLESRAAYRSQRRKYDGGSASGGIDGNFEVGRFHRINLRTLSIVRSVLLSLAAAGLLVLAFPPYSISYLVPVALATFLLALRRTRHPVVCGVIFGWGFFAGLIYWVGELGLIAVAPLVFVFGLYPGLYGWLVARAHDGSPFFAAAVGGWSLLELVRVRFPVGGFEWGLTGYPMGEYRWTREAAAFVGTSGWGVVLMAVAAGLILSWEQRRLSRHLVFGGIAALTLALLGALVPGRATGETVRAAIVQGSTPCPLEHCFGERRATYEMHLAQTRSIPEGSVDLVVWPEGSTGSFDADPILVPEVAAEIGSEAARIGASFLVGGDRPISETEWINAIVVFDENGDIVSEYRKRHPVPFGEYIPARPLFDWIPALSQVPRDMIRGDRAGVIDLGPGRVGTVISFEGAFARYGRDAARAGAELLVVASNEGSYEFTPVSDQFIGMTRMRSAELGLDVVHAAVTGKSTFITDGGVVAEAAGFLKETVIYADLELATGPETLYARWGEWVQVGTLVATALYLWRKRPFQAGNRLLTLTDA
jgi:apolipoprotein N-acyltransferase